MPFASEPNSQWLYAEETNEWDFLKKSVVTVSTHKRLVNVTKRMLKYGFTWQRGLLYYIVFIAQIKRVNRIMYISALLQNMS